VVRTGSAGAAGAAGAVAGAAAGAAADAAVRRRPWPVGRSLPRGGPSASASGRNTPLTFVELAMSVGDRARA